MTAHPIDTEALRRLADKTTPGPWEARPEGNGNPSDGPDRHVIRSAARGDARTAHPVAQTDYDEMGWLDAEFIAAARTAVPALLDALAAAEHRATRAEARIKAVEDVLDADEHVTKHMGTLGQCRPDVPAIAHDTIRRALEGWGA